MYQLFISDLDGTLLKRGQTAIPESVFQMIDSVLARGRMFAVASGRPYHDLKRFFRPVLDQIYFICSDGTATVYRGSVLHRTPIPPDRVQALFHTARSSGRQMVFMGLERSYYFDDGSACTDWIYGNPEAAVAVSSGLEITEPVYKIAVHGRPVLDYPPGLARVYQDCRWQEWAALGTDKGKAAQALQRRLGLSAADCCAFCDGENDLGLLRQVRGRYVMSHAAPQVKRLAAQIIDRVEPTVLQLIENERKESSATADHPHCIARSLG